MTTFIISDAHVPYQDPPTMKVMMNMVRHFKPNNIIIDGDFIDCVQLSRFNKEPQEPDSFKANIEEVCSIVSNLQKYSTVRYVEGNHESRLARYINDKAPELHGLITIEKLLNDGLDTKIEYIKTVPSESILTLRDDLLVGHFNVARKYTCYTVKALVERFQTNIVQAHTHRLGEYSIRTWGKILYGWESGCLCDLSPEYVFHPNWQNGFLIYTETGDDWNIEIVHINDGKAMFRGKMYR